MGVWTKYQMAEVKVYTEAMQWMADFDRAHGRLPSRAAVAARVGLGGVEAYLALKGRVERLTREDPFVEDRPLLALALIGFVVAIIAVVCASLLIGAI